VIAESVHARFRALALAALAAGLLPVAFAASAGEPRLLAGAFFGWAIALYLCAAGGTAVAALSFERGEAMRPGWFLLSASWLVLAPALLWMGPKPDFLFEGAQRAQWAGAVASMLCGALGVAGLLVLARAWRSSGLDHSTPRRRAAILVPALAVAAALAGPDLVQQLPAALGGDLLAVGDVVTDLLDGALLVAAAPVLGAALELGGGVVAWPWAFLTASLVAWLGYDAVAIYGGAAGLPDGAVRVGEELFRTLAAAGAFSAGIAQRWAMAVARRGR
jgi:hypothetical protein